VIVRRVGPDETALFKRLRLRALAEAPDAFARTYAEVSAKPEAWWEEMTRALTAPGRNVMFLAEAVLGWARERGLVHMVLWVTDGNEPAIALYERLGLAPTGWRGRLPANAALENLEMERAP
jgi:GNAT superfamily N-acetyltransferase